MVKEPQLKFDLSLKAVHMSVGKKLKRPCFFELHSFCFLGFDMEINVMKGLLDRSKAAVQCSSGPVRLYNSIVSIAVYLGNTNSLGHTTCVGLTKTIVPSSDLTIVSLPCVFFLLEQ